MCIAIPMKVTAILGNGFVKAYRSDREETINTMLVVDELSPGDWILVFRGEGLRKVSEVEARRVESALTCVESAMRTGSAHNAQASVDEAFADIIEQSGKLPEHLQKLVHH